MRLTPIFRHQRVQQRRLQYLLRLCTPFSPQTSQPYIQDLETLPSLPLSLTPPTSQHLALPPLSRPLPRPPNIPSHTQALSARLCSLPATPRPLQQLSSTSQPHASTSTSTSARGSTRNTLQQALSFYEATPTRFQIPTPIPTPAPDTMTTPESPLLRRAETKTNTDTSTHTCPSHHGSSKKPSSTSQPHSKRFSGEGACMSLQWSIAVFSAHVTYVFRFIFGCVLVFVFVSILVLVLAFVFARGS